MKLGVLNGGDKIATEATKSEMSLLKLDHLCFQIKIISGPAQGDISSYKDNPTFMLENFYMTNTDEVDACCEHPLSTITYHIQLQRRTQASIFNYVIPCVFINVIGKFLVQNLNHTSYKKFFSKTVDI